MDNIILVQENQHTSRENKNKGMVIKMYMVKTFERVCHSFVYEVLQRFQFDEHVIQWIHAYIVSPWITMLEMFNRLSLMASTAMKMA